MSILAEKRKGRKKHRSYVHIFESRRCVRLQARLKVELRAWSGHQAPLTKGASPPASRYLILLIIFFGLKMIFSNRNRKPFISAIDVSSTWQRSKSFSLLHHRLLPLSFPFIKRFHGTRCIRVHPSSDFLKKDL